MMRRLAPLMILCCALGLTACGNNDENNDGNNTNNTKMDMTTNNDMSTTDMTQDMVKTDMAQDMAKSDMTDMAQNNDMSDMTTTDMVDMGQDDMTTEDMTQDMAQGGTASLTGKITRSAAPGANGDAKGSIYIGVFTENPLSGFMANPNAMVVATAVVADADLSANGASVDFKVEGIPVRPEAYYVTAFLDDNGNVDPNNVNSALPDTGDLIAASFMNFMVQFPQVSFTTTGEVQQDFDLSLAIPAFGF